MKKSMKLIIRLLIVALVTVFIYFGVNVVLNLKYKDKFEGEKSEWDWNKENDIIFNMLLKKYPSHDSENFLMVINKDEDIPKKEEGEKRILVVGDSFIYGYGGSNINYAWWKQLNLQIKEAGYSNVNVFGAGRYFKNTKDELEEILKNETLMKKIDPDLVIIGYVQNDPEERDETNLGNLVKEEWEIFLDQHPIYQKNPAVYYEMVDRMNSLDAEKEYDKIIEIGDKLGFYRWDVRALMIAEGERLERYKTVLKDTDEQMKKLDIPYFYFMTSILDSPLIRKAFDNVYDAMQEMGIKVYYDEFYVSKMLEKYNLTDINLVHINPTDSHPGIIWTYEYGKKSYNILKKDYSFLFEDAKMQDIDELDLNINDTMPFVDVDKVEKNVFEFVYPEDEYVMDENYVMEWGERDIHSNFLYYPIEKNYIKLNLEYPKKVKKIILSGENLDSAEIYVNTIDEKYGFDMNEALKKVTPCKYVLNNTYKVDEEITSVNIVAKFKNDGDRTLKIKFVE